MSGTVAVRRISTIPWIHMARWELDGKIRGSYQASEEQKDPVPNKEEVGEVCDI